MYRGTVFGREIAMQGGPYALAAYRREFGASLFPDLAEACKENPPDLSALLQVAWAMAKTAEEGTSPYVQWLREFDSREFSLGDSPAAAGVIYSAVSAELFRGGAAGRCRRIAAGFLGRLAKRAGALEDRVLAR